MNMWVAIAFLCVPVGCAMILIYVLLRRREPEGQAEPDARVITEPVLDLGSRLWATNRGVTDRDEGVSLERQPAAGISFESLTRRSAQDDRPRMDLHELTAAQQRTRIASDSGQPWRHSGRATVRDSRDGDEARMFDDHVAQRLAERAFDDLLPRGTDVRERLGRAAERVDLAWPHEAVLGYDGGVTGYFMSRLDPLFLVESPRRGRAVRTLDTAKDLNDAEVLELVRTVAQWLRAMHTAGVVFGDLGQRSLAYATGPMRIRVLDYDTVRVAGRCSMLVSDPEAEHDPLAPVGESSYDSDRFLFAQLAFRLLVTRTNDGAIAPEAVPAHFPGLDVRNTARLRHLWQRATGPRGTRPTLDEWVVALGES